MRYLFVLLACAAAPAAAEVKSVSPAGFEIANTAVVNATPEQVYAMLGQPAKWWNKAHSYSGSSDNLSLTLRAGGCFCEAIPADHGSVEHGRVINAQPGKALRIAGAFGPLQAEGVSAVLTWALKPVAGGTEVTQTYVVGGYIRVGADKIAPPVDQVLGEQLKRLQAVFAAR
ncbi:SRPBCC domain-containing protein [Sphingomonas tabacisoli]|uniref:SRPBCC domain-containing protein n=1 Tax=Sphingomonas tabacisoli TaxID=2249466 RepID=A0ABW4I2A2_9SPHN